MSLRVWLLEGMVKGSIMDTKELMNKEKKCVCGKKAICYLGWDLYFCDDCEKKFDKKIGSLIPTIIVIIGFIVFFLIISMA